MKLEAAALIIISWVLLYFLFLKVGCIVLDKCQTYFCKRWGESERFLYGEQKKDFKFYLTAFFLVILVLFIALLLTEKV